jgi:streptogramin lyase
MPVATPSNQSAVASGAAIHGIVHGGQSPIQGAAVYLLAANTTGYGGAGVAASSGNASISLLNSLVLSQTPAGGQDGSGNYYVTTDAKGAWGITGDYTCPSASTQVYLYSVGGSSGAGANSAAGLLAALGPCGNLTSSTYVIINEVSTIAMAYSVAGFATDATHVSSSGSTLALQGITNAFATATNLETLTTGVALATTPAGNGTVPQTEINTLANILAACVNSTGPGSSTCDTLFSNAMNGSTAPSDTATAAINIAHNPGANISALYGLQTASTEFQPALSAAPNDFTIVLSYTGGGGGTAVLVDQSGDIWAGVGTLGSITAIAKFSPLGALISPAGGFTGGGLISPNSAAIDLSGNIWVANGYFGVAADNDISEFSSSGAALSGTSGYTNAQLSDPESIAMDAHGNVWVGNHQSGTLTELNSSGVPVSVTPYSGGGLSSPRGMAIDTSGNVWATDKDNNSVVEFNSSGAAVSTSPGFAGGGIDDPQQIAVDGSGNIWVSNTNFSSISKLSSTGAALSPSGGYTGGGLGTPFGIAIDADGNIWVAGCASNCISEFNSSGTAVSGAAGYTSAALAGPAGIAVDGSGNVWVSNASQNILGEYIGAAAPVVTPIAGNLVAPYGSHAVNRP